MAKFVDSAGLKTALTKVKAEIDAAKTSVLATKATSTKLGLVMPGTNMTVGTDGKLNVPTANGTALGVCKQGTNVTVSSAGAISVATATASALGVVKVGTNLKVSSGTISVDTDKVALKTDVQSAISDLVGGAPEALDTLNEIATALGNDANLSATLTTEIGKKANSADVYTKTTADSTFVKSANLGALTTAEINTTLAEVWPSA